MSKTKLSKKQWKRLADKGRWSEADAHAVVAAWRTSGQRVQAFAREHGVGAWRLRYWAPRLEAVAKPSRSPTDSRSLTQLRLVPAVITGTDSGRGPAVVIRLPDGIAVELHGGEHTGAEGIGELVARLRGPAS